MIGLITLQSGLVRQWRDIVAELFSIALNRCGPTIRALLICLLIDLDQVKSI